VVDDDKDILDLLAYNLEKEGFVVRTLDDSTDAVAIATDFRPDLVILDIMMPGLNGMELCRQLRSIKRFEQTYIFFLTARSDHKDQQAALDTGGDDFIEKVVGLRALTYKVSTVLKRRYVIRKSIAELTVGNLCLNRKFNRVTVNGQEVSLSRPEFELLFFFAQNPRKVISQEHLLRNIWGSEIYLVETSIDVYLHNLRRKLGLDLIHETGHRRYRLDPR